MVLVAFLVIRHGAIRRDEAEWLRLMFMGLGLAVLGGLSFLSAYRRHQIGARQRELAERALALAAQAQLAQAQIQPHFLFNSLASLQHWVQQGDDRAAPLLDSLTSYLRATLPLFNRQQLSLGEELEAVRQYLAVMQASLGARLQVQIEVPEALGAVQLPPALMLTLVENAIEHGVVPKLGAALLRIEAHRAEGGDRVPGAAQMLWPAGHRRWPRPTAAAPGGEPRAPGPRPWPQQLPPALAQTYGDAARLTLSQGEHGGCVAELLLPLNPGAAP